MRDKFAKIIFSIPFVSKLAFAILNAYFRLQEQKLDELEKNYIPNQRISNKNTWFIRCSVPRTSSFELWGDLHFAKEIMASLKNQGKVSQLLFRTDQISMQDGDVNLVIRGLLPSKIQKNATNILWVISHPSQVGVREVKSYDFVFAASESWAKKMSKKSGKHVFVLNQATNPKKFFESSKLDSERNIDIVFVGNSKNRKRPIVKAVINAGYTVSVFGSGWDGKIPKKFIKGLYVNNFELPDLYRKSKIVLNDHWKDMRNNGFISNRIFDAVACGAIVVSDHVEGIDSIFENRVLQYTSISDIENTIKTALVFSGKASKNMDEFRNQNSFDARVKTLIDSIE